MFDAAAVAAVFNCGVGVRIGVVRCTGGYVASVAPWSFTALSL